MGKVQEIWKDIIGLEGYYQISNRGNVRSLDRRVPNPKYGTILLKGKPKAVSISRFGYVRVMLAKYPYEKWNSVHQLVANAFLPPKPKNKNQINHINGIKSDNRPENLEWCNASENQLHSFRTGLHKKLYGQANPAAKLDIEKVKKIRTSYSDGAKIKELANAYSVSRGTIENIVNLKSWVF